MAHQISVSTAFSEDRLGHARTELDGGCIRELLRNACGRTFRVGCAMAGAKARNISSGLWPD
jgi:hypothetical protein